jgi:hypothetical protein
MICNTFCGRTLCGVPHSCTLGSSSTASACVPYMNNSVQGRASYDDQNQPQVQNSQLNRRAKNGRCPDTAKNRPVSKASFLV